MILPRYGKIPCPKPEPPALFRYFENLVAPYPDAAPPPLPRGFFAFLWACARGMRRYIAAMTLFTALIGVFEALLFSVLGRVVDWLAKVAALATLDRAARPSAALDRGARGQHRVGRPAKSVQAAGACRQLSPCGCGGIFIATCWPSP